MKDQFGSRLQLVGRPDSGDSAYARLYLDLYLDTKQADGFRTVVSGREAGRRQRLPKDAILRQQVAVTRSTSRAGRVISALPTPVEIWVEETRPERNESWAARAFNEALKH